MPPKQDNSGTADRGHNLPSVQYIPEDDDCRYPLFKFMTREHARALLEKGEICLSYLSEFMRAPTEASQTTDISQANLIQDNSEGTFLLKDLPPDDHRTVYVGDCPMYCTTSFLFSDSLKWALEEQGKNACVMILDSERFFQTICEHFQGTYFCEMQPCHYVKNDKDGRYPLAKNREDGYEIDYETLLPVYFAKPKRYAAQREVRGVFFPQDLDTKSRGISISDKPPEKKEKITRSIPKLRKFLMEVKFDAVNTDILFRKKPGKVKVRAVKKTGKPDELIINKPGNMLFPVSPVVLKQPFNQIGIYNRFFDVSCGNEQVL